MKFDKEILAQHTKAILEREPDMHMPEPRKIFLAQGVVHVTLTPHEAETVLITDDRRDCDGILFLTLHENGSADVMFIHHTTDDITREATITALTQAAEAHGPGIRFGVLVTSQSFLGDNPLHGTTKVFSKLQGALKKFICKGRLDVFAIDPDTVNSQNPSELFFHRYKDTNTWVYELGITNTDFYLRFTQDDAQKFAMRRGTTTRIESAWE